MVHWRKMTKQLLSWLCLQVSYTWDSCLELGSTFDETVLCRNCTGMCSWCWTDKSLWMTCTLHRWSPSICTAVVRVRHRNIAVHNCVPHTSWCEWWTFLQVAEQNPKRFLVQVRQDLEWNRSRCLWSSAFCSSPISKEILFLDKWLWNLSCVSVVVSKLSQSLIEELYCTNVDLLQRYPTQVHHK